MATARKPRRTHLSLLALEDRTVPAAMGLLDTGFEASGVVTFKYTPAGSPWAFAGNAGLSANNTAFTAGNPGAPQGGQVAFLQNKGSITQNATLAAGTYVLSFSAAQRGNQASAQTFNVVVDGKVVGTFNGLTGSTYSTQTTSSFAVTAGAHTIAFQGTNLNGGDNTAFIDSLALTMQPTNLADAGFESPTLAAGAYQYAPAASPWSFAGSAGVTTNANAFTIGNPNAPQGSQVAFLQGTAGISQKVTFTAGTYTLSFAAAQRGNWGTPETLQVLVDNTVVGTFNTIAGTAYNALTSSSFTVTGGDHTITFRGTNLNGGDSTLLIDQVAITQQPVGLGDSGFEGAVMPGNGFDYNPIGTPWLFTGTTGVSANGTGFTAGNPNAPQGEQVAFLQGTGSVTQAVTFAAGNYTLTFNAAQRGNWGNAQTFNVLVDGNVVGAFNSLAGATYTTLTTDSFTVTAGSHTITFQGTNQNGGDSTLFFDQIALTQVNTTLTDGGFENFTLGTGGFTYNPAGSAWAFAGDAGVTGNGSQFTSSNSSAPQGTMVAFLQNVSSISQAMPFAAGTYTISFSAAQRGNLASAQTFQVLVDGSVVATFNNLTGSAYSALTTSSFTVAAGTHTLTFQGTNLNGGDNTVFIDNVLVNQQQSGLIDTGFESPAVALGGFTYNPTGSAWSFTGQAGLAANNSPFTSANANAPQGSQVAFLQNKSSISQTANFTAGNYTLSFNAAQRANTANAQILQVLVDGTVVSTFGTLKGSSYQSLTTPTIALAAGNHIITFQGTNATGDNTVFIDGVTVNAV
jgi:hypothetical protein